MRKCKVWSMAVAATALVACSGAGGSSDLARSDEVAAPGEVVAGDARPAATSDPTTSPCASGDRFYATDLGKVIVAEMIADIPVGSAIADNTSYLTPDGKVRLYFVASYHSSQPPTPDNGSEANGIHSAVSADGTTFSLEDGLRIPEPAGHPKLVQLGGDQIRIFHLVTDGLGSHVAIDGLSFEAEGGVRLKSSDAGMDRVGGMSVVQTPDGLYRGYFGTLGVPGVPPSETTTMIKSATTSDMLTWAVEAGVRIGEGAQHVTEKCRQPFALARAAGCVTLFFYCIGTLPTRIKYAHTSDGLNFTEAHELVIDGYTSSAAGPNVQRLPDGSWILYFDAHDDADEWHIRAARLSFAAE